MISDGAGSAALDSRGLAHSLVEPIRRSCNNRLSDVTWFKADWQRGGAATGNATWQDDDGGEVGVVLKLPVGTRELMWTRRLQDPDDADPVVPRLYAGGSSIDDYDLAWMVIERFDHGPLGLHWHKTHIMRIAEAVARFHRTAARYAVDQPPRREPWDELLDAARQSVRTNAIDQETEWNDALKNLGSRLDAIVERWRARPIDHWLHGDVHVANAMSRHAMDEGRVSLIDLAEVHAGHWIEDAVYLERQCWARPERLKPVKPVKAVADARRALGLTVGDDFNELAMIRRGLLAATAPCFLKTEGHPRHLAACLKWLRTALSSL